MRNLNQPVGRLSGGERARVLIAQLMLQPADVLLLDEPTNDLDIPTLEILEESLLEYRGALVLVTHDRYMLDRVSTIVLGLDGAGQRRTLCRLFAMGLMVAFATSEADSGRTAHERPRERPSTRAAQPIARARRRKNSRTRKTANSPPSKNASPKPKKQLEAKRAALEDPEIASDATRLHEAYAQMEAAQKAVDELYARWGELEQKKPEHLKK